MFINAPFLTKTFSHLKGTDKLGHGYLFFGESVAARDNFTRSLLNFLEKDSWETAPGPLLEALEIHPEDGSIGINSVRAAINFLSHRPVSAPRRVVAIYAADTLTREAQNALLKIVEEPPPYGVILFSARDPELLAPALVSRLARVYVGAPSELLVPPRSAELAAKFIKGSGAERKILIKNLTAAKDNQAVDDFIGALIMECRKDLRRHHALLKELVHRSAMIAMWSTNRKLQLETLVGL